MSQESEVPAIGIEAEARRRLRRVRASFDEETVRQVRELGRLVLLAEGAFEVCVDCGDHAIALPVAGDRIEVRCLFCGHVRMEQW